MNWSILRLLYVHEMRMLLRSRRMVITSVVLPAVVMPLLFFGSRYVQRQGQDRMIQTTFRYAVAGPWAEGVRSLIAISKNSEEFRNFRIEEVPADDPAAEVQTGNLDFYLNTMTVEEADSLIPSPGPPGTVADGISRLTGIPAVRVIYRGNQDLARRGAIRMIELMRSARRNQTYSLLLDSGFPSHPEGILAMTASNVATNSQVSGSNLGRVFTVLLLMSMVAAGSIAAIDIIAGEKERGTLETLITTGAGRIEIATAKQLAICSAAMAITLIQTLNALFYFKLGIFTLPEEFDLSISAGSVLQLFALFVPMAAAISAALLIISAFAKTYKEAQLHFFPLYLGSLVPAMAAVLPGLRLRSIVALVPIANVSVAAREVLTGRPDPPMILVTIAVMTLTAAWLTHFSARLLVREDIVVPAQHEEIGLIGGLPLFQRRVFRWFAVMWAVMFTASANISWLQGFRQQLLFNEIGIFIGGSLLMMRHYRLNAREIIGVRRLRWPVWAAVLMAVPATQIVALAFFKLVSLIMPSQDVLVRDFGRDLLPTAVPMWQMYLLVALLPAVCEELAFRGLLLQGLRRRLHPVVLCILIGVIFGIFHYTLFRLAPTAFLGVLLTAIALMTGSILPGILFHAANNAFVLWAGSAGINFNRADWTMYIAGFAVFALAMQTIYRVGNERTLYDDKGGLQNGIRGVS